jgi:hypothetical protein
LSTSSFKKHSPRRISTALACLADGSLILFGSPGTASERKFFQLDTVFVVGKSTYYNTNQDNINLFNGQSDLDFYNRSYLKAFPNRLYYNLELSLYEGVKYEDRNKFNEMYSFVPSQLYNNNLQGFSRVKLVAEDFIDIFNEFMGNNPDRNFHHDENFINNKKPQSFKITKDVDTNTIIKVWKRIVDISRSEDNNCVEGVKFY